jgi:hypothetical protein
MVGCRWLGGGRLPRIVSNCLLYQLDYPRKMRPAGDVEPEAAPLTAGQI